MPYGGGFFIILELDINSYVYDIPSHKYIISFIFKINFLLNPLWRKTLKKVQQISSIIKIFMNIYPVKEKFFLLLKIGRLEANIQFNIFYRIDLKLVIYL
jgi:hypothetical protein